MTLDLLSTFKPSHDEMADYHYAYARALAALKHPSESIEHYRLAFVYAATSAQKERYLFERCDVLGGMSYSSEAAICYDAFLQQFPRTVFAERAHLGIADARYRLGEYREALAQYEKGGTSPQTLVKRAMTLQALGRNDEAHKLFRELIEHDPELVRSSPETMYSLGESYRRAGKLHDARIFFELVKVPPFKYLAARGLGLVALSEKRYDDALKAFTVAEESRDRSLRREVAMNRADACLQMGKSDEAEKALLEIKKNYPYGRQYDAAVVLLARLNRTKGKYSEAVSLLRELILRRNPVRAALDEIDTIFQEAKDRDPEQFIKLWAKAGNWLMDPSRAQSLVKIAPHLRRAGKPFLTVCTWLTKYGPADVQTEAWLLLAQFYADLGDGSAAATCLKRANPAQRSDAILRIRAKIALASREGRTAADMIMKVRDVSEEDVLLLLDAMRLLTNTRKETAFCERALQNKTVSPATAVRFGDVLFAAGNRQKALAFYRRAAETKPVTGGRAAADVEWAHYRIAAIAKGDDAEKALKAIQAENDAIGHFATAELKGAELRRQAH